LLGAAMTNGSYGSSNSMRLRKKKMSSRCTPASSDPSGGKKSTSGKKKIEEGRQPVGEGDQVAQRVFCLLGAEAEVGQSLVVALVDLIHLHLLHLGRARFLPQSASARTAMLTLLLPPSPRADQIWLGTGYRGHGQLALLSFGTEATQFDPSL
jgi:hypothetical protein